MTPAMVHQALAKAHAARSFGDGRMIFRTDRALALRLQNHKVMSILLDDLQAGRDAQSGEASLILRYAPWFAICARESSKA